MEKIKIAIIEGTVRPGRLSIHAARFVYSIAREYPEVEAVFVDPLDFPFEKDGDNEELRIAEYSRITQEADAFFIITPEYNYSYPGSLKRMLDSEFGNYKHKPVALAGVSNGQWGGVRAIESLIHPLRKMGMTLLSIDVQFPKVQELFNDQGELQDPAYIKRVKRVYDELIWMTKAVKWGRDNL